MALVAYRPLDQRWLYNKVGYIDRLRPELQAAWGTANVCLIAPEDGAGHGPAVWCHGAKPDQHAFRGSYGGWVFPLRRHAGGAEASYLHPAVIAGLGSIYGTPPGPLDVFDAILALLSATSYTTRFAADLEDDFPHVPLPVASDLFARLAALGAEIRAVQSFARDPLPAFRTARIRGTATGVTLAVPPPARAFRADGRGGGAVLLQPDASLLLTEVPERVWNFEVSGYKVLYRWLAARTGEALDQPLLRAALDLAARLAELVQRCDEADILLPQAIDSPLTRTDLGLPPATPGRHAAPDLFAEENAEA